MKSLFLVAATLVFNASAVLAQSTYPNKPIRVIIPFPPGNTSDIVARLIAPKVTERTGQPWIVENRPGASGTIGLDAIARANPDGYTIGMGQGGNMVIAPHTFKKVPYDALKDFQTVAIMGRNYLGIVANTSVPFKTLTEMVGWAKSNPGKLTVATNGEGGFPHLAFEHFAAMAGITFQHIPYKGSAAIVTDLAGGQVQAGIDGISGIAPHIRSGRIRLLAITNDKRVALWPETPTANESVPGYTSGGWFGMVAAAGVPREIIAKLNQEINFAMNQPDVKEKMENAGLIVDNESPEHFDRIFRRDYATFQKLIKDIGYQPQ
jgi:tripartite-type tricarboxylate transporter receptor subunit TctC